MKMDANASERRKLAGHTAVEYTQTLSECIQLPLSYIVHETHMLFIIAKTFTVHIG